MQYLYYPGCSLEGTALEYDASTRAIMDALGIELLELEDWTCCGASAGDAVSYLLSLVLPARNLALAEHTGVAADILVPCSACYLNLKKVKDHYQRDEEIAGKIDQALSAEGLSYKGVANPRHLLDVLANDVGAARISREVRRKLIGLQVAPYYGCQCLRPYEVFDDPEQPTSMEPLIRALGAEVYEWGMGASCCGAGLVTTKKPAVLDRVGELLHHAEGADCIATVCPMCQTNLAGFQRRASKIKGEHLNITVFYLSQLIGLALGIDEQELKLNSNFAYTSTLKSKLHALSLNK
jgi:heterodisulfide reductase subunit B2